MIFDRPKLLIEEIKNNRRFFVEQYNKTIYLYISNIDLNPIYKIIWLANLTKAPDNIDIKSMNKGKPARMNNPYCLIPEGIKSLPNLSYDWSYNNYLIVKSNDEIIAIVKDIFSDNIVAYSKYISGVTRYGNGFDNLDEKTKNLFIDKIN